MLPISIALVFVCLSRYLFNSNTDNSVEKQLDRAEKLNEQTGLEAYRIREAADDSEKRAGAIKAGIVEHSERIDRIGKQVESTEKAVGEARTDNKRADEILKECLEIIEKAEKEK
jgi:hypothetical protein